MLQNVTTKNRKGEKFYNTLNKNPMDNKKYV